MVMYTMKDEVKHEAQGTIVDHSERKLSWSWQICWFWDFYQDMMENPASSFEKKIEKMYRYKEWEHEYLV